jgi:hypothetical protein
MTKQELIELARDGKAYIHLAYTISRYCITKDGHGGDDTAAVYISISDQDGGVHDDAAYYTDGDADEDLTDTEAETLRAAIEASGE